MADGCDEGINLIYACSGGSDVGFVSDRLARMLSVAGYGNMSCLAGLGADIESFVKNAGSAKLNIVVDGCGVKCGKKIMEKHKIPHKSIVLTEFGFEKNKTGVSEEIIKTAFTRVSPVINEEIPDTSRNAGGSCGCGG